MRAKKQQHWNLTDIFTDACFLVSSEEAQKSGARAQVISSLFLAGPFVLEKLQIKRRWQIVKHFPINLP